MVKELRRCLWAQQGDKLMQAYHDCEWGRPERNSQKLFELLTLEIFQSGLSWQTVLHKRANFRRAFVHFDIAAIAHFTNADVQRLLNDATIIRNRQKITATINNAQIVSQKFPREQFSNYIWSFTHGQVINHCYQTMSDIPKFDNLAWLVSQDLRQQQFKFIGPTIVYAFLQAAGVINDHTADCFLAKNRAVN